MAPVPAVSPAPSAAASMWASADVQRVLMLLAIIAMGKLLQGKFSGPEAKGVNSLLLQFLVPATLFKGLSKETIELSHMTYVGAGIVWVGFRTLASYLACYGVLGWSKDPERAAMRRTAIFQISTTASALSVLPFITTFLGEKWVGSAAIVDLPMKLYMLIAMPVLLKMFGEKSSDSGDAGSGVTAALLNIAKDPISLSLLLGIVVSMLTGGGGTATLGFVGKAIDAMAAAQTPVLFLLIGLKLSFASKTPLFCVVLLLATQGVLLIMVNVLVLLFQPDAEVAMFMVFFAQGAASVVGMGVITNASKTIQGYDASFAMDVVGMAFPISSLMQCSVGVVGSSYPKVCGGVGLVLLALAATLRLVFASTFKVASDVDPEVPTTGSRAELATQS